MSFRLAGPRAMRFVMGACAENKGRGGYQIPFAVRFRSGVRKQPSSRRVPGGMTTMDKRAVAEALREISLYLQLHGENAFKTRAYDVAADRMLGLTEDLSVVVAEQRVDALPGIGEALAKKITELVTTGRLGYLEELRAEVPPEDARAAAGAGPRPEEGGDPVPRARGRRPREPRAGLPRRAGPRAQGLRREERGEDPRRARAAEAERRSASGSPTRSRPPRRCSPGSSARPAWSAPRSAGACAASARRSPTST